MRTHIYFCLLCRFSYTMSYFSPFLFQFLSFCALLSFFISPISVDPFFLSLISFDTFFLEFNAVFLSLFVSVRFPLLYFPFYPSLIPVRDPLPPQLLLPIFSFIRLDSSFHLLFNIILSFFLHPLFTALALSFLHTPLYRSLTNSFTRSLLITFSSIIFPKSKHSSH